MIAKNDLNNFIPIVLCAGFGKRLKPLTNYIPKVACPIINKPAAFLNIEIFFKAGFEKVYCNTHYLETEVRNELNKAAEYFGYDPARIVFWHEEEILETGGGISRIYHELLKKENIQGKNAIVISGDIVADFPLEYMLDKWNNRQENDFALMCTKETPEIRKDATWVSKDGNYVIGFGGNFENKENAIPKVFTNHQIIGKELLNCVKIEKKSSIDIYYRKALSIGKNIINLPYPKNSYWFDIGTPINYLKCINFFEKEICNKLEDKFYFNKSIVNHCFSIPNKLKELMQKVPLGTNLPEHSQNQIIISFRELEDKNQQKKLLPLNILDKSQESDKLSDTNEFSLLI